MEKQERVETNLEAEKCILQSWSCFYFLQVENKA